MKNSGKGKVLFVIGSLDRGGAEHQMVMLIDGLVRLGWECRVFVLDDTGPLRHRLQELRVPIHSAHFGQANTRLRSILSLIGAPLRLAWIAARWRPDVVHGYLPLTNLIAAIAGRLAFVPLVITSKRALATHQQRRLYWPLFDRLANFLSTAVTCNSVAVGLDSVRCDGISTAKLVLIKNGLVFDDFDRNVDIEPTRRALNLAAGELGIVAVGNLIPYKGHSDLLDAIGKLPPDTPPYKVFIIGRDDGIGSALQEKARRLGIDDHLVLLGARNDVLRLLQAMDLFILPSHEEGSSNALLEAMATGLPIIATDVGGNAEALDGGRLGSLVAARDSAALAAAIERFFASREVEQRKAGEAAKFVRDNYSKDSMIQSHVQLYNRRMTNTLDVLLGGKEPSFSGDKSGRKH